MRTPYLERESVPLTTSMSTSHINRKQVLFLTFICLCLGMFCHFPRAKIYLYYFIFFLRFLDLFKLLFWKSKSGCVFLSRRHSLSKGKILWGCFLRVETKIRNLHHFHQHINIALRIMNWNLISKRRCIVWSYILTQFSNRL